MDAARVTLLRELLGAVPWAARADGFARELRRSVTRRRASAGGLLVVGTERYEPWHLAAHLDDEARWSGVPELAPTLVRHRVPDGAPAHLAVPLRRLERVGRGATLLVVAPEAAGEGLLERVHDARRGGAAVFAMDRCADADAGALRALAHEAVTVGGQEDGGEEVFEWAQHLVSAGAGAPRARRGGLARLGRMVDELTAGPPLSW